MNQKQSESLKLVIDGTPVTAHLYSLEITFLYRAIHFDPVENSRESLEAHFGSSFYAYPIDGDGLPIVKFYIGERVNMSIATNDSLDDIPQTRNMRIDFLTLTPHGRNYSGDYEFAGWKHDVGERRYYFNSVTPPIWQQEDLDAMKALGLPIYDWATQSWTPKVTLKQAILLEGADEED